VKVDLRSILGAFCFVLKFGEGVCCQKVRSFSTFMCVPSGFPGLQEVSCCAGVILV